MLPTYGYPMTQAFDVFLKQVAEGRDALAAHGVDVDRLETIEHDRECTYEKLEGVSCFDEAKSKIEAEKADDRKVQAGVDGRVVVVVRRKDLHVRADRREGELDL